MATKRGFGTIKPNGDRRDSLRIEEMFDMYSLANESKGSWVEVRFTDHDMLPYKTHWIKILAGKDKREVKIPKVCVKFNPDNEQDPREAECPYCEVSHGEGGAAQASVRYLANAIIRDLQEDEPRRKADPTTSERKTGYKDKKSKAWTPIRILAMPAGLARKLQELTELNVVKNSSSGQKKAFPISHPKFGCDVQIKYDDSKSPSDRYSVQKGERTPLSEDEKEYLAWDLENADEILSLLGRETEEEAQEQFKRMTILGEDEVDDEDDEDDMALGRKSRGKKRRQFEDDDADDDEPPFEEDDKPARSRRRRSSSRSSSSSKKPARTKSRSSRSSKDDDGEDDKPARSRRRRSSGASKKPTRTKSRRSSSDDDDEDWG